MFDTLRSWFGGNADAQPTAPNIIPVAMTPPNDRVNTARRQEFWTNLLSFARGSKKKTALSYQVRSLKLPSPTPGVLPKGKKAAMAMDSQIADTYKFGAAGAWDGAGFMGYAYLAELTQIPEFRIPCEKLANDMTRKWGKVVSTSEDGDEDKVAEKIRAIAAEFERLHVQECFRRAFEMDGEFGVAKIWFDLGENEGPELATALDVSLKVKKGGLKGLRVVEPLWTYPNKYNSDNPLREDFYRPETWFVLGQEVHSTRFMTFSSRPVPDILKPAYMFGGISLIQLMWVCVENWMRTRQSVSDLIHAFSVMVLSTDLAQNLTPEGAQSLALRAQAFNELRDNLGVMIVGQNEGLTNVAAPLGSLDKLQAQSQEHMAAIATIPLIVLFGLDPAGLNATGDGQIRVYNQTIEGLQERVGNPNMRVLLDVVQMSLFEEIDETLAWEWEPLWTMTAKEQAEIRKLDAETDGGLVDHGIVDAHEVRAKLASDPNSSYSAIDVDDVPEPPDPANEGSPADEPEGDHDARLPKLGGDAEFSEPDHPRDKDGKFASSGSSSVPNSISPHHATAIKAYTGASYRQINGHLRGGTPVSDSNRQAIEHLDDVLGSASLPEAKTVYRGLGSLAVQQLIAQNPKAGSYIGDLGFLSTSSSQASAQQFFNVSPKNVMMTVKLPKGAKALDVSKHSDMPGEQETLVARGSIMKVMKWDPKARKLEVEMMPHGFVPPTKGKKISADSAMAADADQNNEWSEKMAYSDLDGVTFFD